MNNLKSTSTISSPPGLAVFDMAITARSPAGSCVLAEVHGLSKLFKISVFTSRFDAREGSDIEWIKIPLPRGPLFLRYWVFQLLAPIYFARWSGKTDNIRPVVQATQGQYVGANVAYAHFCHRAYLGGPWKQSPVRGARRVARWINHNFNAFFERRTFQRAACIVVPSRGLERELVKTYPALAGKVETIANPVDIARFSAPPNVHRAELRRTLGMQPGDVVFSFMALGDFDRKGLRLVFDAVAQLESSMAARVKVLVIGGQAAEIDMYRDLAQRLKLTRCVVFVGMQSDVRPYLWASDVFVFPSLYEIFSLAILQAAAAGLPVIVTKGLYGAEEFVVDGLNGWQVQREAGDVKRAMSAALERSDHLDEMGVAAMKSVAMYSEEAFVNSWSRLYSRLYAPEQDQRHNLAQEV